MRKLFTVDDFINGNAVVFSRLVQSSKANRIIIFGAYVLVGLASRDAFFVEGYIYWRLCNARLRLFGRSNDGSGGFVFDELLEKKSCSLNLIGRINKFTAYMIPNLQWKQKVASSSAIKLKILCFSAGFHMLNRQSANFAGKLPNRCLNQTKCLKRNILERTQFKLTMTYPL